MMPRYLCCQGGTLRALISALIVVQCALILLYWDATRNSSSSTSATSTSGNTGSSNKPLHLQAKASQEHLQSQQRDAQRLADIPEAAARRFRENYETGTVTKAAFKQDRGNGKDEVVKGKSKSIEHQTNGEAVNNFGLISPETELLLFKPSTRRKYPDSGRQSEQTLSQNDEPNFVVQLEKNQDMKEDKSVNNPNRLLYPNAQEEHNHIIEKSSNAPDNVQRKSSKATLGETVIHGTPDRDQTHLSRPKSEKQHSSYTPRSIMQNGGAVILNRALTTPTAKSDAHTTSIVDQEPAQRFLTTTQHLNLPTAVQTQFVQQEQDVSSTTVSSSSLSAESTTAGTTYNPWVAAHLQRKKAIYPTFDKPMPLDPYSIMNSTNDKLLYTTGSHEEFHKLTPGLPQVFHLPRGTEVFPKYFTKNGVESCFKAGTATNTGELTQEEEHSHHEGCLCKRGWHGRHCSIPEGVFSSTGARFVESLKPRNISRRVISALAFNVEFELLEARLNELDDVVDVFIILESNYTNFGDPKPLLLLQRMREGYLKQYHHKIVYLFRGHIPQGGRQDGWIVDQHMRMFIGQEGMSRVFNSTQDDLFLYTDADEIPSREALLFLRIHDGYSEPIGVSLRWSVFGFFWKQFEATRVVIGCTVGMFRYVFNNDAFQLRSTDYQTQASSKLHAYIASGAFIYDWYMGDNGALAGWHCSWCLPPERIRVKLTSAINADFPRWGDFPEKLDLNYLRGLIKTGTWFDDKSRFGMLVNWESEELFAPRFVLNNYERYKYLLDLDET